MNGSRDPKFRALLYEKLSYMSVASILLTIAATFVFYMPAYREGFNRVYHREKFAFMYVDSTWYYIGVVFYTLYLNSYFFIVTIWLWLCYIKHVVFFHEILCRLDLEAVDTQYFHIGFRQFIQMMSKHSDMWRVNHMVRTVTSLVIASSYIGDAFHFYRHHESMALYGTIIIIFFYYSATWSCFIAAGFVNDQIKKHTTNNVIFLEPETDLQDQRKSRLLLEVVNVADGLKVGGITQTVEKAFSLGSFILTIITFAMGFITQPSS